MGLAATAGTKAVIAVAPIYWRREIVLMSCKLCGHFSKKARPSASVRFRPGDR